MTQDEVAEAMTSADYHRNWRRNWLQSIAEIADIGEQRRLWLDPDNTNPHNSYLEYCCSYFDDLALSDTDGGYSDREADGLVSRDEADAVSDFHATFAAYGTPNGDVFDNAAILADEKWQDVVASAERARQVLAAIIVDVTERQSLSSQSQGA